MKLADYSDAQLKAELRRRAGWDAEPPERFCDDCQHFACWKDDSRPVPPRYNVCSKKHKMDFYCPPFTMDFGFHRDGCPDFLPDPEPPPTPPL